MLKQYVLVVGRAYIKLVEHGGMTYEGEQTLPQT